MDPIFEKPLKEESTIRYRGRNHSAVGRLSIGIGVIGWVIFLVLIWESRTAAAGSSKIGITALADFVLAVFGMLFGGRGLRESNVFYRSALSGVVLCATLAATLFGLFLSGTAF
ncbi:MAG: hypothetical protein IJL03_04550 [Lachnospiraceae bacterium]|nr:hypothetical protein [Lachnospiraceae bacterium]